MTRGFEDEEFAETLPVVAEGQNLMKASLFNLILVSNSVQGFKHCQEFMRVVTEKFPCRIILVHADPANPVDLFNYTRSVQAVGTGANRVCFDQISIESSMGSLSKVPFLVLPDIMPDLPVYLVLGYDPTQDQVVLPQLERYADRVIFDAKSIENLQRFSERMLQRLREEFRYNYIDVNWARTKAWREIFARVFNDAQKVDLLRQSKMIQISFSCPITQPQPGMELQSLYFQAWLAAQLNWNFVGVEKEEGIWRISYHSTQGPITLTLVPKDTQLLEIGALFSVEIMTYNDAHSLISTDAAASHVTVHASNRERCEMPYTLLLPNFQTGTALVCEIFYQAPSEHYLNMIQTFNHPAWAKCTL